MKLYTVVCIKNELFLTENDLPYMRAQLSYAKKKKDNPYKLHSIKVIGSGYYEL